MNFTFAASKPPDMTFGSLKPDGNWTGMIGELVNQNADISIILFFLKYFKCLDYIETKGGKLFLQIPYNSF